MALGVRHEPAPLALLAAAAILPAAVAEGFGSRPVALSADGHFALVLTGGLVAAAASIGLTVAGARRGDGRTVLLGCAFSTMTALLAVHGLTTPGVLVGLNGVVALAGAASLPTGAAVLALSALPALRRPDRIGPLLALQALLAAGVLALGWLGVAHPQLVPMVPATGSTAAIVLLAIGLAFYTILGHRALRTFGLTRRWADLGVAIGCVWLAVRSCRSS